MPEDRLSRLTRILELIRQEEKRESSARVEVLGCLRSELNRLTQLKRLLLYHEHACKHRRLGGGKGIIGTVMSGWIGGFPTRVKVLG